MTAFEGNVSKHEIGSWLQKSVMSKFKLDIHHVLTDPQLQRPAYASINTVLQTGSSQIL